MERSKITKTSVLVERCFCTKIIPKMHGFTKNCLSERQRGIAHTKAFYCIDQIEFMSHILDFSMI